MPKMSLRQDKVLVDYLYVPPWAAWCPVDKA